MKIQQIRQTVNTFKQLNTDKENIVVIQPNHAQITDLKNMPFSRPQFVSFKGEFPQNMSLDVLSGLKKVFRYPKILNYKEVELFNKLENNIEKVLFAKINHKISDTDKTGLAILNKEGKLVSSIESLDYEEYKKYSDKPYLMLKYLHSPLNQTYKGAGTKLIQAAVEESLNTNLNGSLKLIAGNYIDKSDTPIPFYLKKGFSFKNSETTMEKLKQDYRNFECSMSFPEYLNDIACEEMILTKEDVNEIWKPIIAKNPIFDETISRL